MSFSLPETFSKLPRYPLLYPSPSPIHPLPALTRHLNHNPKAAPAVSLFAKREDHSSPLACAGNKYRKLEYIVPDILANSSLHVLGARSEAKATTTLVTEGAIQSNHTVQVASVARRLGLEAIVILHKATGGGLTASSDKNAFLRTGNVQIARLLGAEVRMLEDSSTVDEGDPITPILEELRAQGKVPYWIPSGASLHPLGGLGYARCAFEIAAQEKEQLGENGRFDYIFVACGSGSTVGGLIAGFRLLQKLEAQTRQDENAERVIGRKVIGILNSPTKPREYHEGRVLNFALRAAHLIGLDPERDVTPEDVHLDDRFAGTAYGELDPTSKEILALIAQEEGVIVDPVYTVKVMRGIMHWVQEGELTRDWSRRLGTSPSENRVNALFIHTGGQSALSAYADIE
ncbi:tryptophan synthase beta subunit-like PLP-dependent enzyme [Aspergillus pseudocaelatus]|uniref:Tryptophan synthase beta subunit-like PLP-dependent enzyme n=1 Tax=Aspergillus pseudocaelatus TaxID=1825620 RepID=A0ABQ6W4T9_9EURO|nr:tryptophan synthase beta subunit-like PLP-dependent enzyme [Aspergillus pseudocaelatus]